MSVHLTPEQEADAELIAKVLVPIAAELVPGVRELGPEGIAKILAKVPEGKDKLLHLVLAAMVSPDASLRSLLGWTDTMVPPPMRGRAHTTADGGYAPPGERERQRLVAAGVPADTALVLASRMAVEEQDTSRARMLRVVHGEQEQQAS